MKREITVYDSTKNGKMTVFKDVEVNTLRDLKNLLDEEGIDYTGVVFNEGVTGTRLLHDDSVIPDNIPFKGEIIHDVFINMLVQDNKVSSGLDRKALYELVRPYADKVKEYFGKNYTNVSTEDLANFAEYLGVIGEKRVGVEVEVESKKYSVDDAIEILKKAIYDEVEAEVKSRLEETAEKEQPKSSFSEEDIASFLRR